jgi:hypothetical protein
MTLTCLESNTPRKLSLNQFISAPSEMNGFLNKIQKMLTFSNNQEYLALSNKQFIKLVD